MNTELLNRPLRTDRYQTRTLSSYPAVIQENKSSKTSNKYSFVSTMHVLENLADNGWLPTQVIEMKTRKADNRGFQKHCVRLSNQRLNTELSLTKEIPEILLINSHNAGSSFQLMLGVYRLVCSNGLISGDSYADHRITHIGYTDSLVTQAINAISYDAPKLIEQIEDFKQIELDNEYRKVFAESAIELIKDDSGDYSINPSYLLNTRRADDRAPTLWNTYNAVQENIVKGNYYVRNEKKRTSTRARKINSLDRDCKVNRALWTLTEKMAELTHGRA